MRRPLLLMRTRGLHGPFFGRHAGNRASHPLAHSQGNAISGTAIPAPTAFSITELIVYMIDQGWSASPIPGGMNVNGIPALIDFLLDCDFGSITPGSLRIDLCDGMKAQGFCLSGNCM